MPVPKYSLLKAHPVSGEVRFSKKTGLPHYHVTLELPAQGGGAVKKWDVAVNIQSQDGSEVLYQIRKQFPPPHEADLTALDPALYPLTGANNPRSALRVDYVLDKLTRPEEMVKLPIHSQGDPPGALHDEITDLFDRAFSDPASVAYFFGSAFPDNSGIHDTHMNQGNPKTVPQGQKNHFGDNGRRQDGAIFVFLPGASAGQGLWVGVFIAFQSQGWDNDANGNPKPVAPLPQPLFNLPIGAAADVFALPASRSGVSPMVSAPTLLPLPSPAPSTPDDVISQQFSLVLAALAVHGEELSEIPGVVVVRPDFSRDANGYLTDEPVLQVAAALLGIDDAAQKVIRDAVPSRLGNVRVQVVPATAAETTAYRNLTEPRMGAVGFILPGQPGFGSEAADLIPPPTQTDDLVPQTAAPNVADVSFEMRRGLGVAEAPRVLLPYAPPPSAPPNADIPAVTGPMKVTLHISPDAGWPTLKSFLEGSRPQNSAMVTTMYEFTEPYIVEALLKGVKDHNGELHLILDPGANRSGDTLTKDQIVDRLRTELGDKFHFEWAAVPERGRTTNGYFPSAYHIKVSVRDKSAFWLSSGNWKSSNQPDDDVGAMDDKAKKRFLARHNREWHVVIENAELATVFDTYIRWDIREAAAVQSEHQEVAPVPQADMVPQMEGVPGALADLADQPFLASLVPLPTAVRIFPPRTLEFDATKPLTVKPLLTPDNYVANVLTLLKRARTRLWFQNQSFSLSRNNPQYAELLDTLRMHMGNPAIDVRVIIRADYLKPTDVSNIKAAGFDLSKIHVQNGCHNKGILIDSDTVVVGSHNWTGAGTTENRDASLIFHNTQIMDYYEEIFDYDWTTLSRPIASAPMAEIIASRSMAVPEGMMLVPLAGMD